MVRRRIVVALSISDWISLIWKDLEFAQVLVGRDFSRISLVDLKNWCYLVRDPIEYLGAFRSP